MSIHRNTMRIVSACLSMSDCDTQRAWLLITSRSAWHKAHSSPRMATQFAKAASFFDERYEGLFVW